MFMVFKFSHHSIPFNPELAPIMSSHIAGKPKNATSNQRGGLSSLMLQRPVIPIKSFKLDMQDQELIKLEKFGKLLAGPNTSLGMLL